jgi:hypothetical protein
MWTFLVELRRDLDIGDDAGGIDPDEEPERPICQWCRMPIYGHEVICIFSMKEYWGPLRFDDRPYQHCDLGVLIGGEWRWVTRVPPDEPAEPYCFGGDFCSEECLDAFRRALRHDTAERRPQ